MQDPVILTRLAKIDLAGYALGLNVVLPRSARKREALVDQVNQMMSLAEVHRVHSGYVEISGQFGSIWIPLAFQCVTCGIASYMAHTKLVLQPLLYRSNT